MILTTRFARAGAVGFVVAWAAATLAMTAASIRGESRPAVETGTSEATATEPAAAATEPVPTLTPPETSISPPTASAVPTTVSPSRPGGDVPVIPVPDLAESVETEVLPAVADAAQPNPAQPDFTG